MNALKVSLLCSMTAILVGCAGSPVHTSNLSDSEMRNIDPYTLCKAATEREMYSPSPRVMQEVYRRGLNCRTIYQYQPTPQPQQQQQQRSAPTTCVSTPMGPGMREQIITCR